LLKSKNYFKDVPLSLFFLCFGVLLYTPLLIIYLHNKQNPYSLSDLAIPVVACLSAAVISMIINKFNARISSILEMCSGFIALYIFISVNIYPLKSGILDGKSIPLNKISVVGHVVLAIVCFWLLFKSRETGKRILYVIGSLSLIIACYIMMSLPYAQKKDSYKVLQVGKANNMFIIVIDMFQGYFVSKYLERNTDMMAKFDGFTYFNNAVSVAPYTIGSTRYILTGKPPKAEQGAITEIAKYDNVISDAVGNGYTVKYVTITVPIDLPGVNTYNAFDVFKFKNNFLLFAYTCSKRYFPSQFLPEIGTPMEGGWLSKTNAKDSFQWFSENLYVTDTIPKTFHYYHNLMTHLPIRFNSKGVYSKNRTPDDLYGEISLSFNMLNVFIERLKKIGIYDDSTIIITGDHGYDNLRKLSEKILPPDAHYLREPIAKMMKGQHDVALLVKAPHSTGAMCGSDSPVVLTDLRKTINEIMLPGNSKSIPGENILQKNMPTERKVRILSYVNDKFIESKDFGRFDNWEPLEITIPIRPK